MASDTEDKPTAVVMHGGSDCNGGIGWYWWDEEYPEEGSAGAFKTRAEAVADAEANGFAVEPATRKLARGGRR